LKATTTVPLVPLRRCGLWHNYRGHLSAARLRHGTICASWPRDHRSAPTSVFFCCVVTGRG
jgi:hypothetical protein